MFLFVLRSQMYAKNGTLPLPPAAISLPRAHFLPACGNIRPQPLLFSLRLSTFINNRDMAAEELTNRIKVFRAARSISQEELAVAVGVTRKTINTIETGKYVPSTVLALRIARYFGVPVEEVFSLADGE